MILRAIFLQFFSSSVFVSSVPPFLLSFGFTEYFEALHCNYLWLYCCTSLLYLTNSLSNYNVNFSVV
jgi:hypothetical protein